MNSTKLSGLLEICKRATAVGWGKGVLSSHSLKLEDGINFIEERYHAVGPGHSYDDEDKIMEYDAGKAIIADAVYLAAINPQVAIELITKLQKAIEGLEFYEKKENHIWEQINDEPPESVIILDGGDKARQILAEIQGSGEGKK